MAIRIDVNVENIECCRFPLRCQKQTACRTPPELVHFVFAEKLPGIEPSHRAVIRAHLDESTLYIDYAQVLTVFQYGHRRAFECKIRAEIQRSRSDVSIT